MAPQNLEAIVKTESNYQPLITGVNGGSNLERQPVSLEEAAITAQWLLDNGYNIDLGLGQVNSSNLNRVGLSVHDAFEPCKNIKAAGILFNKGYQAAIRQYPEEQAFKAALSAYNTGNIMQGFGNGYVQRVLNNMPDKSISPSPSTLSMTVQPIPLANSQKPTLPHTGKTKNPEIQQASLTVESPPKESKAFVYASEGNRESPAQNPKPSEPPGNVYGGQPVKRDGVPMKRVAFVAITPAAAKPAWLRHDPLMGRGLCRTRSLSRLGSPCKPLGRHGVFPANRRMPPV